MNGNLEKMRKHHAAMSRHSDGFEKSALFDLGLSHAIGAGTRWVFGESISNALNHAGQRLAPAFLRAGVELAQRGEKANPYVEDAIHTLFGEKGYAPYKAGLDSGHKITPYSTPEEIHQHIADATKTFYDGRRNRINFEKDQLGNYGDAFNVSDPEVEAELTKQLARENHVTDAVHRMLHGEGDNFIKGWITHGAVPSDAPRSLRHEIAQASYAYPMGKYVDSRFLARPISRALRERPDVQRGLEAMANGTKNAKNPIVSKALQATGKGIKHAAKRVEGIVVD